MIDPKPRPASEATLFKAREYGNPWLKEVLPDGSWKGKPCAIIGGGPSLGDFPWRKLKGMRTIGVNRAFERVDPTIMFSMDTRFLNWILTGEYGKATAERLKVITSYKTWLATYRVHLPGNYFLVPVHKNHAEGLKAFTFTQNEGIGHGDNSGYAALNLAVCLGANPIYLLGFDCKHRPNQTHWHDGHKLTQQASTVAGFIKYFNRAAPKIRNHGFKVLNLCPDSALECFPRKHWKEIFH